MAKRAYASKDEEKGRILPFRPRAPRSWNAQLRLRDQMRSPVDDLSKYSRGPDEDNYRHRMMMNLLAFLVLALIVSCGIWLPNIWLSSIAIRAVRSDGSNS